MLQQYGLAIIGGGPAGYSGAIHAAKKGISVVLIEQADVGGTCLNRGCIPSKVMLEAATLIQSHKSYVDEISINEDKLFQHRSTVVKKLRKGIEYLLKKNKITIISGKASLNDAHTVEVETSNGTQLIHAEYILLATGSKPRELKQLNSYPEYVINSDDATQTQDIPKSITIIGAGAIGVEFAYIYRALGSHVTLIEMMDRVLPGEDIDISNALKEKLESLGIHIITGKSIETIYIDNDGITILLEGTVKITSQKIFSSTGRQPNIEGLRLEECGIEIGNRSQILVDGFLQTHIPTIYAAGDVTGRMMLAHVALSQAITAVDNMFDEVKQRWNGTVIPRCVYISPEIACVGLTEQEALLQGISIKVETMPFAANGKAVATGEEEGFIKVIANQKNQILGVHIFGPRATDMISQGSFYISNKFDVNKVAKQVYPHPTYSETLYEAILNMEGKAIHF